MSGILLTLPDDPRFDNLIGLWPGWEPFFPFPRSAWLRDFEDLLREYYPTASSDDLTLTARHYFPGFLAAGHNVP